MSVRRSAQFPELDQFTAAAVRIGGEHKHLISVEWALFDRERQARSRDEADLGWLTVSWERS
jgi:catechol-2,3-dioxygenase